MGARHSAPYSTVEKCMKWSISLVFLCWRSRPMRKTSKKCGCGRTKREKPPSFFDMNSGPIDYRIFELQSPPRLVVDISNTKLATDLDKLKLNDSTISSIRSGTQNQNDLRVVLDLRQKLILKPPPCPQRTVRLSLGVQHCTQNGKVSSRSPSSKPTNTMTAIVMW